MIPFILKPNLMKRFLFCLLALHCIPVQGQPPVITSFSPASGTTTTPVTINGSNLPYPGTAVFFGGTFSLATSGNGSQVVAPVPGGAVQGPLSVKVNNLIAYSSIPFYTTFPLSTSINSFSFKAQPDISGIIHPREMAVADLDGDKRPDFVVSTDNNAGQAASIAVYRCVISTVISFTRTDLPIGGLPTGVATGDFDGDGKTDIAGCSVQDKKISVYRNTSTSGNISFAAGLTYPTGTNPVAVSVADMNLDGKLDIITANNLDGNISIFINNSTSGSISFLAASNFVCGAQPLHLTAGDFDNDNKTDIVVVNENTNTYSIFRNTSAAGSLSLASRIDYSAPYPHPVYVTSGDLNRDSKLDLLLVCSQNTFPLPQERGYVTVFKNESSPGSFALTQAATYYEDSTRAFSVQAADINGDGKPELITCNRYENRPNGIAIRQNTGVAQNINFSTPERFYAASPTRTLIADFNSDRRADIIVGGVVNEHLTVLKNSVTEPAIISFSPVIATSGMTVNIRGTNFKNVTAVKFGSTPAQSYTVVDTTSINAVLSNGSSGNVTVTTSEGTASLSGFTYASAPSVSSFIPSTAYTGDTVTINGSQFYNITAISFGGVPASSFTVLSANSIKAVVGNGASGDLSVISAYGSTTAEGFTFLAPPVVTALAPISATGGDTVMITGNNFVAISSVSFGGIAAASFSVISSTQIRAVVAGGNSGNVVITNSSGQGMIAGFNYVSYPVPVITSFTPLSGIVGTEVTLNGLNFNQDSGNNIVYFGAVRATVTNASPTQLKVIVPHGSTFFPISVLNKDYRKTGFSKKPFVVLFNTDRAAITNEIFEAQQGVQSQVATNTLCIADFDSDGKPDIASGGGTSFDSDSITYVHSNKSLRGSIRFGPGASSVINSGLLKGKLLCADFNNDGKPDLARIGGYARVFTNTSNAGNIAFSDAFTFTERMFYDAAVKDMDNDGRTDLLSIMDGIGGKIGVFRNTSYADGISFNHVGTIFFDKAPWRIAVEDLNGDDKPEVVVLTLNTNDTVRLYIFRNSSAGGVFSFDPPIELMAAAYALPDAVKITDVDADDRPDIISVCTGITKIFRNTGTNGSLTFNEEETLSFAGADMAVNDIDGDGKVDLIYPWGVPVSCILKNNSTPGLISFVLQAGANTINSQIGVSAVVDMDGDGNTDMVTADAGNSRVNFKRNTIGKPITLCPVNESINIPCYMTGANYQWQESTDSVNYNNISDGGPYLNTQTATLRLVNPPSALYGNKYRCIVDGVQSGAYTIAFENRWSPTSGNNWENPANWFCGNIPDANTNVVIPANANVIINSNIVIRSLKVNTGAVLNVSPGFTVTVLQ